MTLRHSSLLALALAAPMTLLACDDPDPSCRCEGMVPEGALDLACGESACVGGTTGYVCTGPNMADFAPEACLMPTDGGPVSGEDGGPTDTPDMFRDTLDMGPRDGGGCTMVLRYVDGDGDGHGDPTMSAMVCLAASGYVDSSDDCDDGNRQIHPGASESCDGVDTDCDEVADPAGCGALEGTYTGSYEIRAEERLGGSVINAVHCTGGSYTVTVDLEAGDVLSGTATCTYSGSLSGFDSTQSATLTGTVEADGSVSGRLVHDFGDHRDGSFSFDGAIAGGALTIEGTGGYRPNSMSAVAWDTEYSLLP